MFSKLKEKAPNKFNSIQIQLTLTNENQKAEVTVNRSHIEGGQQLQSGLDYAMEFTIPAF